VRGHPERGARFFLSGPVTNAPALRNVFVTGATGFVGRSLEARLGVPFRALHFADHDWREQVGRADFRDATVFHLAARVHGDGSGSPGEFALDNVEKTRALALAARAGGARRFVFLSTIKVNGEETGARPFCASDPPHPQDDYARSKWEAEKVLAGIEGVETVIVRAPLVYGPGVKGNLRALLRLADTPWPLPFAAIRNRRSFVHVDDLARLLAQCAAAPQAPGAVMLAAHEQPVSTTQLVATMRRYLGRPARLFEMPRSLLEGAAAMGGAGGKVRRLTRSLEIDPTEAMRLAGWRAEVSMESAVEDMVRTYREAAR
jgi:UDP-glucose 4-epimerase